MERAGLASSQLIRREGRPIPTAAGFLQEVDMNHEWTLELEFEELETAAKPGCTGSSTSPRCTCPVIINEFNEG